MLLMLVAAAFAAAQVSAAVAGTIPAAQAAPVVQATAEQRTVRKPAKPLHIPAFRYGVTIDSAVGAIIRTEQGSAGFSQQMLQAKLPFRYGYTAVSGGTAALLSGMAGATADMQLRHGSIALEAGTQNSLWTVGIRAALTEWDLNNLRIKLPATELKEQHLVHRLYHAGVSAALPAYTIRYDGDWYWGKAAIGLHDLGVFIAQPSVDTLVSVQRLRLTQWYEGSIAALRLHGTLSNKTGETVASGTARAFVFQNTVDIPIAAHSTLSFSASYIYFSGIFSIRLTTENQGYFLFPYRFYHRDIRLSDSVLGFGGSYAYTAGRLRFFGTTLLYSVIQDTGSDEQHSKEKKSLLFKGREEKSSTPLPRIAGTSLLLLHFSLSCAITSYADISIRKTAPIPILSPELRQQSDQVTQNISPSALIIDPLFTGLSFGLTICL